MAVDIVLKEMILNAPSEVTNLDQSILSIQSQIDEFTEKQTSLTRICNTVITDFEKYLLETKFPGTDYFMYQGPLYNQITSQTGTFTDWIVYKNSNFENPTYVGTDTFSCDGDQTSIFIEDFKVSILDENDERVYSTVKESSFDGNVTQVILNDSVLTTIESVWLFEYSYISGDDSTIDGYKTNWDFSHDYITQSLGLNGTYGTLDNITQLNNAKNLLSANKSKINSSITIFEQFLNI